MKVAIIDDAYDPPAKNNLRTDEIEDFWEAIIRDEESKIKLNEISPGITSSEDISDETIIRLWQNRGKLGKLDSICDSELFVTTLQKIKDVDSLHKFLKELGLEVLTLGSKDDLNDNSVGLIFIDYYFESPGENNPGCIALEKVKKILKIRMTDPNKPFFVLMSAQEDVSQKIDQFCNNTKLLKGLFDFVPKSELNSKVMLYFKLKTLAIGMPARHKIQQFVDAIEISVNKAANDFTQKIRGLSLEDYINVQLLCLQPEGEPLGEYLLELFNTLLPNVAFENDPEVQKTRNSMDQLSLEPFIPAQRPPSLHLAEIYRISITQPINKEIRSHPRKKKDGTSGTLPYIQFGDLFINKNTKHMLMVANPSCDLSYSPGEKREGDPDYSVILVPGELKQLIDNRTESKSKIHITPLFELDGQLYRIDWEYEHLIVKKFSEIIGQLGKEGYTVSMRLRLPYALQLQQKITSNLTRVGLPEPPPIYESVDVESFYENDSGNLENLLDPIKDGGYIIHLKDNHQLVLTIESYQKIISSIGKVINVHENKLRICSAEKKDSHLRVNLASTIRRLKECKDNGGALLNNLEKQWDLPEEDKAKDVVQNLLCIYFNKELKELSDLKTPICLNIRNNKNTSKETKPAHLKCFA